MMHCRNPTNILMAKTKQSCLFLVVSTYLFNSLHFMRPMDECSQFNQLVVVYDLMSRELFSLVNLGKADSDLGGMMGTFQCER